MKPLGFVGSDLDNFGCPVCKCSDRDRHLFLYLQAADLANRFSGTRVLHIAPEPWLVAHIGKQSPSEYVLGDLEPGDVSICKLDLESLPFLDASFDWLIANHVLEHVADLDRALAEIYRVLKPGGFAILQTPWAKAIASTVEATASMDVKTRRVLLGQEDHVRLFGIDVARRLSASGLKPSFLEHSEALTDTCPKAMGVNSEEHFMLFRR